MRNEIVKIYRQHAATLIAIAVGFTLMLGVIAPLVSQLADSFATLNAALGGGQP